MLFRNSLRWKLVFAFLMLGIGSSGFVCLVTSLSVSKLGQTRALLLQSIAERSIYTIDRVLSDRATEVCNLANNSVICNTTHIWNEAPVQSHLTRTLERFLATNSEVHAVIIADKDGKIAFQQSQSRSRESANSNSRIGTNAHQWDWYPAITKKTGTGIGIGEFRFFSEFGSSGEGSSVYGIPIVSAVVDSKGQQVAELCAIVRGEAFEAILVDAFATLDRAGMNDGELTLLNAQGTVVAEYDPSTSKSTKYLRNAEVLGKRNLIKDGVTAATLALEKGAGFIESTVHSRKKQVLTAGMARSSGVFDVANTRWALLVRVPYDTAMADVRYVRYLLLVNMSICFIAVSLIALVGSGAIGRQVQIAREMIVRIGNGDFTSRLPVRTHDEIGQMCASFNAFADKMQATIQNANHQSRRANERANSVVAQLQTAADTTNHVSSHMREVSAAISQMNTTICHIAKSSSSSSTLSQQASSLVNDSCSELNTLEEAGRSIGSVVAFIEEIAEQTNLLALNATIEAARAGDSGKGFAVVASEVKELARQTSSATEDIRKRVASIQRAAGKTAASIKSIAVAVESSKETAAVIAAAVEEQSQTTASISKSIADTADAAASVASGVSSSAELSRQITQSIQELEKMLK